MLFYLSAMKKGIEQGKGSGKHSVLPWRKARSEATLENRGFPKGEIPLLALIMRGYKHTIEVKQNCRLLRSKGLSINEIKSITGLPKTTIYERVKNLSSENIKNKMKQKMRANALKVNAKRIYSRRIVLKPTKWSKDLIFIVAHFMFDGEILHHRCVYTNRSKKLIGSMKRAMERVFGINPIIKIRPDGVTGIVYHYTDLAKFIDKKSREILKYILKAEKREKRIFLKAFFDDEGCISFKQNIKKIRGFQHSQRILKLIQYLLKEFNIPSRLNNRFTEIVNIWKE